MEIQELDPVLLWRARVGMNKVLVATGYRGAKDLLASKKPDMPTMLEQAERAQKDWRITVSLMNQLEEASTNAELSEVIDLASNYVEDFDWSDFPYIFNR